MRHRFLLQTISQLAFLSFALAAHDRKVSDQITKLPEHHYNNIPGCMVNCISRVHRSHLPHCTPDKYYDKFKIDDFIRDQDVAGCFCRDLFFLKGFSECIIETCKRPTSFYRSVQWGYDTCAAQGVDLLDPQNLPKIPDSDVKILFKHWGPHRWIPHRWRPEVELRRIEAVLEEEEEDDDDDSTTTTTSSATVSWSTTVTSLVETTKVVVWSAPAVTTTVSGAAAPTTITTTVSGVNGASAQVKTLTTTVSGAPGTTATVSVTGPTTTIISGVTTVLTTPIEKTTTATTTLTTVSTQSASSGSSKKDGPVTVTVTTTATPSPSSSSGMRAPAKPADEVKVEIGQQSLMGPACVSRCYENPNKAGWFTDAKYKDDIHPECKSTYDKYIRGGMNTKDWSEEDQRKLSRCVCTHRSYVKSLSECGLKECSASNGEIFSAILFGYQVCSKKGAIEFPYVDVMIEKLGIFVPGNVTLPDRVGLAANGVGGAPTFPILDEDGEQMMFPNGAGHTTSFGTHSFMATYVLGALLFVAFW